MKKTMKKLVAALMLVAMMASVVAVSAFAATKDTVGTYNRYVVIGDSIASGFGLPDYNRRGSKIVYGKRITGSYADLVAKDVHASNFVSLAYPGFCSGTLRYELQDNYQMKWWEMDQLSNFTGGVYTQDWLDANKGHVRRAIQKADLLTLDIGVNDSWYGTIALIYAIAKYGYIPGMDPRGALDDELAKYGSWGTVARNAMYYLAGFAENPQLWATFWAAWIENLATYFISYQDNYNAIMQEICNLNDHCTIVGLSSANSFKYLNLTPGQASGSLKIQFMGQPVQMDVPLIGTVTLPDTIHVSENPVSGTTQILYDVFYEPVRKAWQYKLPGRYFYADVSDYELIKRSATVPMYEFMSLDDSGFNPHPTLAGSRYMADVIIGVLPAKV